MVRIAILTLMGRLKKGSDAQADKEPAKRVPGIAQAERRLKAVNQ